LHLFLVNRSQAGPAEVELAPSGMELTSVQSAEVVHGLSAFARNTFDQPDVIHNEPFNAVDLVKGQAILHLPPLSVTATSFTIEERD
jgi:alpha-L-arabinofuranosidase